MDASEGFEDIDEANSVTYAFSFTLMFRKSSFGPVLSRQIAGMVMSLAKDMVSYSPSSIF